MEKPPKVSIQPLLRVLKENGVPYALLGDPVAALESERENDYDFVVPHARLPEHRNWLQTYALQTGTQLVQCLQHEATAFYYVLANLKASPPEYIKIDFCSDYVRNGRLLLNSEELLDGATENDEGIQVPAPARAFIYYLLKKIDKRLPISGFDYMLRVYRADQATAFMEVQRFFPEAKADVIRRAFEQADEQILHAHQDALRQCLPSVFQFPAFFILGEWPRVWRRVMHPSGLMVAILGSDGSGKTTVIDHLRERMRPLFRHTECHHLRPALLRPRGDGGPVQDPHGKPPRSIFMTWMKTLYWWTEYTGGYLLRILPALIRSTLVVFDRYIDDLEVDPARYRWGGGDRLARGLQRGVPRPSLVFVLDAPPDVLLAWKQEVTCAELERQRIAYQRLATQPDYHLLDAARPVQDIVADMERHMAAFMNQRLQKRSQPRRCHAQ